MAEEKPTTAFVLSLIGGIIILIASIIILIVSIIPAIFLGILGELAFGAGAFIPGMEFLGVLIVLAILSLIFGIIVIVGAIMINSGERGKVRTGGILVLVFSILSLITGGGFFIGFILGLVGGILALVWKPKAAPTQSVAPPPPS